MTPKPLIVAATLDEIVPTLNYFKLPHGRFTEGTNFDVLITGVGITATAFALGKFLNTDHSYVLNVGIAGSFKKDLELGSLANVTSDVLSELGAESGDEFISIDELGFGQSSFKSNFISENELLDTLPKVNGITVNMVHGNENRIKKTLERFDVTTESMEGAAVFYSCQQTATPAIQIRSISNYVELRNRDAWEIGLAIKNLNNWLIEYLKNVK
ncbi:MAG: futalosine hydrolase [Pedobacter sp.]|nr:MAG: futalosine hydrolase [Pedobacter sp.]